MAGLQSLQVWNKSILSLKQTSKKYAQQMGDLKFGQNQVSDSIIIFLKKEP